MIDSTSVLHELACGDLLAFRDSNSARGTAYVFVVRPASRDGSGDGLAVFVFADGRAAEVREMSAAYVCRAIVLETP